MSTTEISGRAPVATGSPASPASPAPVAPASDGVRTGLTVDAFKRAFLDNLFFVQGRFPAVATLNDNYKALAITVRDRLLERWVCTGLTYMRQKSRTVAYLSAEFLLGPQLGNNLLNLGVTETVRQAMSELGLDLGALIDQEEEPGLGNGGLGRLAACYLDSLATLEIPAIGYGIHYEYGIFDQEIRDGWQVEVADKWLRLGSPWEIEQPEIAFDVKFGGHTEAYRDQRGRYRVRWIPGRVVRGVAVDTPVLGHSVPTANTLRLWKAHAVEGFDFQAFNHGDYFRAVESQIQSETLSKVLYPNDQLESGKELRLEQQYFFVSCALQDMMRIHRQTSSDLGAFASKYTVQLNDTHPALAVAELMRLLVDEHDLDWEPAWEITRATFGYTNHTLLPEALERWPLPLFARTLPRPFEIVLEINRRFLDDEVRARFPGDEARVARMSLIDESGPRYVRMANLACVGSAHINGVAELHTRLLAQDVLADFHDLWPERFLNVTNGITPRRFLKLCNPGLAALITGAIGDTWATDLDRLRGLAPLADDAAFRAEWRRVKGDNKRRLGLEVERRTGVRPDPAAMFDVQIKRLHEYKRQHLNVLHVLTLYNRIKRDPGCEVVPRTVLFGGKAAPAYLQAKLIIKLVNAVAEVVNDDPDVRGRLKVVFFPDYNVKNGELIFPAAELSEQISTAGKEASGTGNMKLALNGALTIGTLDGANVEIREQVGADNFFLFGLTVAEVRALRAAGYQPRRLYEQDTELRAALDLIGSGRLARGDAGLFRPLLDELLNHDEYMVLADYRSYIDCQDRVSALYRDPEAWTRMSILNVAGMGRFSSDRSVREYCENIWRVHPEPVSFEHDKP
jgi:starch phosphorylase